MNKSTLNFLFKLPQNLGKVFWGKNLLWHALAITLTYICVVTGFDWKYHNTTQSMALGYFIFPAVILGLLLPFILPLILLLKASTSKNPRLMNTAFALGQAAFLGWLVSAFYKAFTGRPGPENLQALGDITHIFKFGLLRGGVFWGWPSSHTTVAFAMGLTLLTLHPENKVIKNLSIIYVLYIGISVSMSIHWFSDFLAGAIFGSLVGIVVGKSFLEKYKTLKS